MPEENSALWKDKKRILGMPISFTKYSVTNERLYVSKGLFTTEENEILLYRILDIKLVRRIFDKIFGVGTITLYCADETDREFKIVNIKNSKKVRDMLSELVESERVRVGIRGREIYGAEQHEGV